MNACHTNWGNTTNNHRGLKLNKWLQINQNLYNAKILQPDAPTFIRSGNILDIAIVDYRLNIKTNSNNEIASHTYDGDHKAIEIICTGLDHLTHNNNTDDDDNVHQTYIPMNIIWPTWKIKLRKTYQKYLEDNKIPNIIPTTHNIEDEVLQQHISTITKLIYNNIISNSPPKIRRKNNMQCYTNKTIEILYKHKRKLITALKRIKRTNTFTLHQLKTLKTEIKRTNELITQNIKIAVNKYWKRQFESIKPGRDMFAKINRLNKVKVDKNIHRLEIEETETTSMTKLNINWLAHKKIGSKYVSENNIQNLNIIGHYIEANTFRDATLGKAAHEQAILKVIAPIKATHSDNKTKHITITTFSNTNIANSPSEHRQYFTNSTDLTAILNCSNSKKSFGLDNIPGIVLKHLPEELIEELSSLYNHLLNNRSFPECWKTARIFPILKKNKTPTNADSYRPISLLSNVGKIYEIIISNKIHSHTVSLELIPDNQFGFRHQHSTVHAITKLTSDVCFQLNARVCTGAVLIDMRKAFESVWLDGLLFKLIKMKFDKNLIFLLIEMLYGRKFVTTNGREASTVTYNICNGLQQGSITAPVLFNLYTRDLISSDALNSNSISTIAYADDLVVYSSCKYVKDIETNLQAALNYIIDQLHTWRIKVNETKCELILFRNTLQYARRDTRLNWKKMKVNINHTPLEQMASVKYLGINIDRLCYMNEHVNIQLTKARRAFFGQSRIFKAKHVSESVKVICYQSLIRPILVYGCPIWYNINHSYMEKLRVFERRCIRACRQMYRKATTGYKHYLSNISHYRQFKPDRIDVHILKLIRNHILRSTSQTSNSLLYGPYLTDINYLKTIIKPHNIPGPEAFVLLDDLKYTQNGQQAPVIYHINRRPNEKWFDHAKFEHPETNWRFNSAMKLMEPAAFSRYRQKFWWLQNQGNAV